MVDRGAALVVEFEGCSVGFSVDGSSAARDVYAPAVSVNERVVGSTEEHAVLDACFAAVFPFSAVVNIAVPGRPVAPGEGATSVA